MANRVVLDADDIKISKPGVDVLTAGSSGLLLDSSSEMLQVVQSGRFTGVAHGAYRDVTGPDQGFTPFVWATSNRWAINIQYLSATQYRFYASAGGSGGTDNDINYFVFNVPRS